MKIRDLLEKLLAGNFICEFTNQAGYDFLSTDSGKSQVNEIMLPFERTIIQLPNQGAFYLSVSSPDKKDDRLAIRKEFEATRDLIEPVVSFLVFVSRAKPELGILSPGQIIRFSDVLGTITSTEQHFAQLNKLVTLKPFRTNKQATEEKLKALFNGMLNEGLLVEKNEDGLIYQVTGKLDYITNILNFIAEHENITIQDTSSDDQIGLDL